MLWLAAALLGGDIVRLSPETWDRVPGGKETDAIYGDYLMRNDRVVAVIGDAAPGRHANMSVRHVQGAVIDFALLSTNNDQLSAFYPQGDRTGKAPSATRIEIVRAAGPEVVLRAVLEGPVAQTTEYVLRDGESFLRIRTTYRNGGTAPAKLRLSDKIRCDQTFAQDPAGEHDLAVFADKWFLAAYGLRRVSGRIATDGKFGGMFGPNSGTWLDFPEHGKETTLAPGQEIAVERVLIAGRHAAEVQIAAGGKPPALTVGVTDPAGRPVAGAEVALRREETELSSGWTDAEGRISFLQSGGTLTVSQIGRLPKEAPVTGTEVAVRMGPLSAVAIDAGDGPCKAQFIAVEDTPPLNLGPKQRANGCGNLWFSPSGRFTVPLPPGKYYVILSRGPECDAAYRYVTVKEGETVPVRARLPRVVSSEGWISADFHNHTTESGDNTTVVEGRLVCLAAEGVEFAAATEHNRILSYRERIRSLGLAERLETSDGIELTASPLPISHHNAFPLVPTPRTQDGGGPATSPDPLAQLQRLWEMDGRSEKLLQQNHPDIGWLFYDADGDGRPDLGFGTARLTHVIEIWRPTILDMKPTERIGALERNNRVFNWLQLLNQGFRIPGVANTDAHYCTHESGRLRNWVKSAARSPSEIDELEVVRAARKGRIVMSNGPFMEVSLQGAGPGEDVVLKGGMGVLKVRVECPNWLDVDRVQVLANGRPVETLNFTRATRPQFFSEGVVRFKMEYPVSLGADAHLIVVAIGEASTLGPVMGQVNEPPVAISNPIYADVDGKGFTPDKNTLGAPLPVKKQ